MAEINPRGFQQAALTDFIDHQSSSPDLVRKYDKELSACDQWGKSMMFTRCLCYLPIFYHDGSQSTIGGAKPCSGVKYNILHFPL